MSLGRLSRDREKNKRFNRGAIFVALMFYLVRVFQCLVPSIPPSGNCQVKPFLGVNPFSIAIITFDHRKDFESLRFKNKQKYALTHGYDFIYEDEELEQAFLGLEPSRPVAWIKFMFIMKYLPNYDYIMWIDEDAMIMNENIRIEVIVDPQHMIFISEDGNGINSGVFIVRQAKWSMDFIRNCWEQEWLVKGWHPFRYEQRAMHHLYGSKQGLRNAKFHKKEIPMIEIHETRNHFQIVDSCMLNSNVCEEFWFALIGIKTSHCNNKYHDGDFVLHLAGKSPRFYKSFLFWWVNQYK